MKPAPVLDIVRRAALGLGALALAGGVAAPPASASHAGSPAWIEGHNSRVRLIAGPRLDDGRRIAGVHIELTPGWHTYWRNPGDSGVPPAFDWSASANLANATIEWPAPVSIPYGFGVSIGYQGEVVFPVVVTPEEAGEPVDLALDLDYAVCSEICIPQSAALALTMAPDDAPRTADVDLVNAFRARVPRDQADGDGDGPRIDAVRPEQRGEGVVLMVEAASDSGGELFVEGPSPFYFAVPDAANPGPDGRLHFTVEVDGASRPDDLAGIEIRATLVTGGGSVERSLTIE